MVGVRDQDLWDDSLQNKRDVLSEDFIENDDLNVPITDDFSIGCAEYVDDVMTCTLGKKNQKEVLNRVDEFAKMNKLEWGEEKCQVMQVGRKIKVPNTWELGTKNITNTNSYKYLGDLITSDGKNKLVASAKTCELRCIYIAMK